MISGIYAIENKMNGDCYIGSSKNITERFATHKRLLKTNKHHSAHLQNAWNYYNQKDFEFKTLIICDIDNLLYYEQRCIDNLNHEYNISLVAGKVDMTDSVRNKISTANKGKKRTEDLKLKLSQSRKGVKFSEEHKRKISESLKIRMSSEEEKEKVRQRNRSRVWTDEAKRNMSEINTGKTIDKETRDKISNSLLGRVFSDESKAKMSLAQTGNQKAKGFKNALGYSHTEETKQRISNSLKGNCNARKKDNGTS